MSMSQFVIFKIGSEEFATDISHVSSINNYKNIKVAPEAPGYVEGIMNLRGDIIPVINLSKRLTIKTPVPKEEQRIIIMDVNNENVGFLVDDASQTISIDIDDISDTPSVIKGADGDYIDGVCHLNDNIYLIINLTKILSPNQLDELKEYE